jgi:hypothetical protein
MYIWLIIGFLFAAAVGVAAKDTGMVLGALVCFVGGALAVPFVARYWR